MTTARRARRGALALAAALVGGAGTAAGAEAAIVFDGSAGTGPPPATLGGYPLQAFGPDGHGDGAVLTAIPGPTGDVLTDELVTHTVPTSWATWSHGYTGRVYFRDAVSTTLTLPANTGAFLLYAEPNFRDPYTITATAHDGTSSGPVLVDGEAGATAYGFYGTAGDTLSTITVTADPNASGFAIGELHIADVGSLPPGPKCFGQEPTINYAGDNTGRTIIGTEGDDVIYAGNGDDVIDGRGGNDLICSLGGDDAVRGGTGNDRIFGSQGDDDLGGQAGDDEVIGGPGNDRVNGSAGNDRVRGGDGNDILNGGDGDDSVYGGLGDDVLAGNDGTDDCFGGGGADRVPTNGGCENVEGGTVSNNTAAPTSSGDKAVVAAATSEGASWSDGASTDPSTEPNPAEQLPPATGGGSGDVTGGNVTAEGDL